MPDSIDVVILAYNRYELTESCLHHLRGRLARWRAGRSRPRLARLPEECVDQSVGSRDSLVMRRGVYGRRAA